MSEWTIARCAKAPAVLAIVLLVASNALTDRWYFTQGVWWIPRLALALPAILWLAALLALARFVWKDRDETRRLRWWTAAAVALGMLQAFRMWGLPADRPPQSIRLVHWNPGYEQGDAIPRAVEALAALDADIVVLTDASADVLRATSAALGNRGFQIEGAGKFHMASRFPVREARPLLAARNRFVSRFVVATAAGEISIESIDLPSAPTLPRALTMRSLKADLAEARPSEPDILVGDFNITRGSYSLTLVTDGYSEAFETAGTGWGASYPRVGAFIGIDLAFFRAPWIPLRSQIVDPGAGRHRAQVIDFGRADPD